ncbi:MAG TPA: hypothetical protein VLL48_00705 [Longimicrobiales bacterium]|nr:hypothetical protein [Longimicrobiales bacterium]
MSDALKTALRELNDRVLGRPGVAGTAVGERKGRPCLKVFVEDPATAGSIPTTVRGVPVVAETTGPFRAR